MQWTGGNADEVEDMYEGSATVNVFNDEIDSELHICNGVNSIVVQLDDFIILGASHPCKPEIFNATYEAVKEG